MALVLNEEQIALQDAARDFLGNEAPVEALRKLRDERSELGYSPELWNSMAEMGWASIILPEAYGGLEFGFLGQGVVLEEAGRTLAASPLFCSGVIGASAILLGGSEKQKSVNGALIEWVKPGGPGDKSGLKEGDVVLKFGDKTLKDFQQLVVEVSSTKPGDEIALKVKRGSETVDVVLKVGKAGR